VLSQTGSALIFLGRQPFDSFTSKFITDFFARAVGSFEKVLTKSSLNRTFHNKTKKVYYEIKQPIRSPRESKREGSVHGKKRQIAYLPPGIFEKYTVPIKQIIKLVKLFLDIYHGFGQALIFISIVETVTLLSIRN